MKDQNREEEGCGIGHGKIEKKRVDCRQKGGKPKIRFRDMREDEKFKEKHEICSYTMIMNIFP